MASRQWSYTNGVSEKPLLGMTIGDMFDQTAAAYPDNESLVSRHQGLRYTYHELQAQVDQLARGLMSLGLAKGERIGIWAPNCAEWCITQFATAKIGAILEQRDDTPGFEIYVARSVARYAWRWLEDAGSEYGVAIVA